ncbi:hypothetical protein KORDIASMS9_02695 [Kordia sp. SMS9]|nr:hypothetical protein KORDIASMS9_02695 [Kordia sp. SMS9]
MKEELAKLYTKGLKRGWKQGFLVGFLVGVGTTLLVLIFI